MSLLIRADAGPEIGAGHVMRCLALAQAYQDAHGKATFLVAPGAPALEERLQRERFNVIRLSSSPGTSGDAAETDAVSRSLNASWIILDGYHFGEAYQSQIKKSDHKLCCIDDDGSVGHYWADLVVNQNLYAHGSRYLSREPYTRLLLGSRYALLRREFVAQSGWRRDPTRCVRRLLVTLGGGDPGNVMLRVLEGLRLVGSGLEVVLVVGPNNPNRQILEGVARENPSIAVQSEVSDMCSLMRWADMAISAAGSTCWELALMQLPSLLVVLAPNQRPVASELAERGAFVNLGEANRLRPEDLTLAVESLRSDTTRYTGMQRACLGLVSATGAACVTEILMGRS